MEFPYKRDLSHTLAQECINCYNICSEAVSYCLEKEGDYSQHNFIQLLLDCMETCKTCAGFLLLGSSFKTRTCEDCAELCKMCAIECEKFIDDEQLLKVAACCRKCASMCQQLTSKQFDASFN